jgi:hypothetical protein
MLFEKAFRADVNAEPTITVVEAESLEALKEAEINAFMQDDRFEPCHGCQKEFIVRYGHGSMDFGGMWIEWCPGDGGEYTIAEYRPSRT